MHTLAFVVGFYVAQQFIKLCGGFGGISEGIHSEMGEG